LWLRPYVITAPTPSAGITPFGQQLDEVILPLARWASPLLGADARDAVRVLTSRAAMSARGVAAREHAAYCPRCRRQRGSPAVVLVIRDPHPVEVDRRLWRM
jgi:hypothetical protein